MTKIEVGGSRRRQKPLCAFAFQEREPCEGDFPGPLPHNGLNCLNHIVDVVMKAVTIRRDVEYRMFGGMM